MTCLIDTNTLLRYMNPSDPSHATAVGSIDALRTAGKLSFVVPQNFYEYWVVATRPVTANGLGLAPAECEKDLALIAAAFPLLADRPALLAEWRALVVAHECKGKMAHDARFVAAMRTHGVTRLLTFNGADFKRFPGIEVLDPATVAASSGETP